MRRLVSLLLAIWLGLAATPFEAAGTPKERPIALPSAAEGWTWDGHELHYDARSVFDYIDGAGELFLAYGFQRLSVRRFEQPNQPPLTLECYAMNSAAAAFGVFSFERQGESVGIGQGSEIGGGLLRFWKGRYFISIFADGEGPAVDSAVLQLGRLTAAAIRDQGTPPRVVGLIPGRDAGLVDTSVRYLTSPVLLNQRLFISHENVLGINRQTGAVLAQYGQDAAKTSLLLIQYPNTAAATAASRRLMAAYLSEAGGADRGRRSDGHWTMVRQQKAFLAAAIGAPSEAAAEALLTATERALRSVR